MSIPLFTEYCSRSVRVPGKLIITFLLTSPGLVACGGGSSGGSGSTPSTAVVSGSAIDGPIQNGTVTSYTVTAAGQKGSTLKSTNTDLNGNYSLSLNYTGPVLLELTGGTYVDDASGSTTNVPTGSDLQAALNVTAGQTITAQITPLTSMAAARAQTMSGGLTAANINAANQQTGAYFGGLDILNTKPINPLINNSASGATQKAIDYGLVLAGISKEAQTLNLTNPFELVTALTQDYSDGVFNGLADSTPVQMNGFAVIPTIGTADLSTAISSFSASNSNSSGRVVSPSIVSSVSTGTTNPPSFRVN